MSPERVSRRRAVAEDDGFVDSIVLADSVAALATVPDPLRSALAAQQVTARRSGYATDWPDAVDWVVEVDGLSAGRLLTALTVDGVHIVDLRLAPRWRGQGVGTAVLAGLCAETDRYGWPVTLSVDPDNPARHLYERLGFVRAAPPAGPDEIDLRLERLVHTGGRT